MAWLVFGDGKKVGAINLDQVARISVEEKLGGHPDLRFYGPGANPDRGEAIASAECAKEILAALGLDQFLRRKTARIQVELGEGTY